MAPSQRPANLNVSFCEQNQKAVKRVHREGCAEGSPSPRWLLEPVPPPLRGVLVGTSCPGSASLPVPAPHRSHHQSTGCQHRGRRGCVSHPVLAAYYDIRGKRSQGYVKHRGANFCATHRGHRKWLLPLISCVTLRNYLSISSSADLLLYEETS